ncbi:MAG: ABC transporter substrate-binding protein, partial [Treponema sp.]|nr:ABC transporter substrate-binding protein [Treponema sp.]
MKKFAILLVLLIGITALTFAAPSAQPSASSPVRMTIYYSDNSTLPFRTSWLAVQRAQQLANADITWEVIPMGADFTTKVSLALNSGINTPDVILGIGITNEYVQLAQNGAIVPISDYANWTPEWVARVSEYGLQADIDMLRLLDGKYYNLASLTDKPFYDSGIIL